MELQQDFLFFFFVFFYFVYISLGWEGFTKEKGRAFVSWILVGDK